MDEELEQVLYCTVIDLCAMRDFMREISKKMAGEKLDSDCLLIFANSLDISIGRITKYLE